ncbi:MAG: 50S ribosomal protein L24 [Planctomycetota bacterium]|nr:MAG: 50S ribosomal protein L24 [Planctomycetota bacterium]
MPRHVRTGDLVIVTAGESRGMTGKVLRVLPDRDRVVVQGVNLRKRHTKPTQANPQGAIVEREEPLHISNVSPLVDGKPSRVRFPTKPDGAKARVAVRGGKELNIVRGPKTKA